MKVTLLFCLLVTLLNDVTGYPQGPPVDSCEHMYPTGHKTDAQTSSPPYELVIGSTTFVAGGTIEVTLRMKAGADAAYPYFEGMFVQARMANCKDGHLPIGTFSVPAGDDFMKTMDCHKDRPMSAVAHKDATHQTSKTFTWTAPNSEPGRIYFRATVVKNEKTFWTNVYSPYVEDSTDTSKVPESYCTVQSTVGAASSVVALTSLVVAAGVMSFLFA